MLPSLSGCAWFDCNACKVKAVSITCCLGIVNDFEAAGVTYFLEAFAFWLFCGFCAFLGTCKGNPIAVLMLSQSKKSNLKCYAIRIHSSLIANNVFFFVELLLYFRKCVPHRSKWHESLCKRCELLRVQGIIKSSIFVH